MTNTDTNLTAHDRRAILRMLWAFYLGALLVAAGFAVRFAFTHTFGSFVAVLGACLAAWFVTNPLDELRKDAP
jgi:purine-cytosine permease-like protein